MNNIPAIHKKILAEISRIKKQPPDKILLDALTNHYKKEVGKDYKFQN